MMAKTGMMCPLYGKLCQDCVSYRGRHYFLCYCKTYWGHLTGAAEQRQESPGGRFEMPSLTVRRDFFEAPLYDTRLREARC